MRGPWLWALIAVMALTTLGVGIAILLDDTSGARDFWVMIAIMAVATLFCVSLHAWITIQPDRVRFGYFPFYRKTLRYHEIAHVESITYRGFLDFGGWGIKGLAKSSNGLLLASSGSEGVRITIRDDRRYVVGTDHADELAALLRGRIG